MQMPKILTGDSLDGLWKGVAIGAVATMFIGFYWGGWVTDGTNQKAVAAASENAKLDIVGPQCAKQFAAIDGAMLAYKAADSWKRTDLVQSKLKSVDGVDVDSSVADACIKRLDENLSKTAEKKS